MTRINIHCSNIRHQILHGKNDFAEVSKILGRYRFKNNFVKLSNFM